MQELKIEGIGKKEAQPGAKVVSEQLGQLEDLDCSINGNLLFLPTSGCSFLLICSTLSTDKWSGLPGCRLQSGRCLSNHLPLAKPWWMVVTWWYCLRNYEIYLINGGWVTKSVQASIGGSCVSLYLSSTRAPMSSLDTNPTPYCPH